MYIRYHSRFYDCLAHPNLSSTLATGQKWPLSCLCISYQSLARCHLPLIPLISIMVYGTLLNFVKRYEHDLGVIFDQWPKFHLGPNALSNLKNLECCHWPRFNIKTAAWIYLFWHWHNFFIDVWLKSKISISVRTLQFVPCYKKESNIVNKCYCICSLGFSSSCFYCSRLLGPT